MFPPPSRLAGLMLGGVSSHTFHLPCLPYSSSSSIPLKTCPTKTTHSGRCPSNAAITQLHLAGSPCQDKCPSTATPALGMGGQAPPKSMPETVVMGLLRPRNHTYPIACLQQLQRDISAHCSGASPAHQCIHNDCYQSLQSNELGASTTNHHGKNSCNPAITGGCTQPTQGTSMKCLVLVTRGYWVPQNAFIHSHYFLLNIQ